MAGTLLRLFLTDGKPDGIKTVEISNMTIIGTLFPRSEFKKMIERSVVENPGVYLIYGSDIANPDIIRLYIGEGDPVKQRLQSHHRNPDMDFWTDAIVFTSKDDYLTKTQIQFIESQLIAAAKKAGRATLINGNMPAEPNMSEVDRSEVIHFYNSICLILEALGFDFLKERYLKQIKRDEETELIYEGIGKFNAKMKVLNSQYVVLKGSVIEGNYSNEISKSVAEVRKNLIDSNILIQIDDHHYRLDEDVPFNTPTASAYFVNGGKSSVNGWVFWKFNGKTLNDIERGPPICDETDP